MTNRPSGFPADPVKLHPLDSDHYQIREGDAFELNCGAEGNPDPVITWSKLVSAPGRAERHLPVLRYSHVQHYVCLAL